MSRRPTHPGAVLREDVIPAIGKSKSEIARLLGISRRHLYDILDEKKRLSPDFAVRIAKLLGGEAGIWTRMQCAHDIWRAERSVDVRKIRTLKAPDYD